MNRQFENSFLAKQTIKKSLSLNFRAGLNLNDNNSLNECSNEYNKRKADQKILELEEEVKQLKNTQKRSITDNPISDYKIESYEQSDNLSLDSIEFNRYYESKESNSPQNNARNSRWSIRAEDKPDHELFHCELCPTLFKHLNSLKVHKELKHNDCDEDNFKPELINSFYKCNKCEAKYKNLSKLQYHRIKAHNLKSICTKKDNPKYKKCDICNEFVENLNKHRESCEPKLQKYFEHLETLNQNEENDKDDFHDRDSKFSTLNNLNITEFFDYIIIQITSNSDSLDPALFYFFLILFGLRPTKFIKIKKSNIKLLDEYFIELKFICKFGTEVKHVFKINQILIIDRIKFKLNNMNTNDYFFFKELKEDTTAKENIVRNFGFDFNQSYTNPRFFRYLRASIEFHNSIHTIKERIKDNILLKNKLISNISQSSSSTLKIMENVKALLCHKVLKSSIYYVDDRIFYSFFKYLIGDKCAKETYLKVYQITFRGNQIINENHWAFQEPPNLYCFNQLSDIITDSNEKLLAKTTWIKSLFH